MERGDLEAQLRTNWTRANLAAYGAQLRQDGDPRGALIEIDLQIARDGSSAALVAQRTALLARVGLSRFDKSEVAYGFVDDLRLHEYTYESAPTGFGVFASTVMGPYVRGVRLSGDLKLMKRELEALVCGVYPWLRRITFALYAPANARPLVSRALAAKLRVAAPQLARIEALQFGRAPVIAPTAGMAALLATDAAEPTRLVLDLGGHRETVELGRLARLHTGIVEELSSTSREAWAELRFAVEQRIPLGPTSIPASVLRDALAELDPATYYVSDWEPVRARIGDVDVVGLCVE